MDSSKSSKSRRQRERQKQQFAPSGTPLHLSALPRFHPATYGYSSSNPSSLNTTPGTSSSSNGSTPRHANPPPLSPRTQQRMFEAQRQLSSYHQNLIAQYVAKEHNTGGAFTKPDSPKLAPTSASPGPVTPLELEERDGYMGVVSTVSNTGGMTREEAMREDALRKGSGSPRRKM